jgi:hypothetical protein
LRSAILEFNIATQDINRPFWEIKGACPLLSLISGEVYEIHDLFIQLKVVWGRFSLKLLKEPPIQAAEAL